MGLLSSGDGGNDGLQVGVIVFCTVISLLVTAMMPMMVPMDDRDADTGYSLADVMAEKMNVEQFTGESMTNQTPWKLTHVYTTWNITDGVIGHVEDDTGWFYGEDVNYSQAGYMGTTVIGDTTRIYMDPGQKSDRPLEQITTTADYQTEEKKWWASTSAGGLFPDFIKVGGANPIGVIAAYAGMDITDTVTKTANVNAWQYTGYRYVFDPMLKIDYQDPDNPNYSKVSQQDATLSIVWYQNNYMAGLSNGLILYNDKTHGYIDDLSKEDILANYDSTTGYSSKYNLNYEGVNITLNIKFDQDVIAGNEDLSKAFDDGRWSLTVTAKSMDNFMDIKNSNSLSFSGASIIENYSDIMTFNMPNVPIMWQLVLWVCCVLPLMMVVMMFFTRSLLTAGVGAGILGSILAIGLM